MDGRFLPLKTAYLTAFYGESKPDRSSILSDLCPNCRRWIDWIATSKDRTPRVTSRVKINSLHSLFYLAHQMRFRAIQWCYHFRKREAGTAGKKGSRGARASECQWTAGEEGAAWWTELNSGKIAIHIGTVSRCQVIWRWKCRRSSRRHRFGDQTGSDVIRVAGWRRKGISSESRGECRFGNESIVATIGQFNCVCFAM